MDYTEMVYPMRITQLNENEFFIDYPLEGMSISGEADSLHEALQIAKSSLEFTLCDMHENHEEFPILDQDIFKKLEEEKESNQYIVLIATSVENIIKRFGEKRVTVSASIPEYQKYWLSSKNISLSKFIQERIDYEIQSASK